MRRAAKPSRNRPIRRAADFGRLPPRCSCSPVAWTPAFWRSADQGLGGGPLVRRGLEQERARPVAARQGLGVGLDRACDRRLQDDDTLEVDPPASERVVGERRRLAAESRENPRRLGHGRVRLRGVPQRALHLHVEAALLGAQGVSVAGVDDGDPVGAGQVLEVDQARIHVHLVHDQHGEDLALLDGLGQPDVALLPELPRLERCCQEQAACRQHQRHELAHRTSATESYVGPLASPRTISALMNTVLTALAAAAIEVSAAVAQ